MLAEYAEEHGAEIVGKETLALNINHLLDWWQGRPVSDVNKAACHDYAKWRRERGIRDGTIRRELSVLSAAIGHAHKSSRLDIRPHVWMPSPAPAKDRWLTRSEAAALLRAARAEPQARGHLPLFILLALYGAARSGAILSLKWTQVDLERRTIDWNEPGRKRTTKGRAVITMPDRLWSALKRVKRADIGHVIHIDGKPVGSIKKGFAAACRKAGLVGVSPHTLRHTAATWAAQRKAPMWQIAGYLGHSQSRTTELYAHHHPDHMADVARALDNRK